MGKVPVVEYVEHLIQTCAGYRTPQAVLYSMDLTFRMVCGKLGLWKHQVRYDDLLSIPLSAFEWARSRARREVFPEGIPSEV